MNACELEATRTKGLAALYAWYSEWTEIAREVVTKGADKIVLGIAKRRASETATTPDGDGEDDSQDADATAPTVPDAPVVPVAAV
jgi:hypothetical protein